MLIKNKYENILNNLLNNFNFIEIIFFPIIKKLN